jgi:hypothetical protein
MIVPGPVKWLKNAAEHYCRGEECYPGNNQDAPDRVLSAHSALFPPHTDESRSSGNCY